MKNGNRKKEQLKKRLVKAYERAGAGENGKADRTHPGNSQGEDTVRSGSRMQRIELMGQLAGNIAQYFNNILTLIIGYGTFLQTKLNEGDPLKPYVQQILASSERAALLTRGLLVFSRKQVVNPKPVSLNGIIRRAGKLIKRIVGERIELRTSLCNEEVPVSADAVQLEQVLMNLATNARDAMPQGGTLTIEVRVVDVNRGIGTPGISEGTDYPWRCALISFSDTGSGMEQKIKGKIFEPFYTTKDPGKGTGLGLSIVYGIVRQHNGSINVSSEPGKGSTFSIYLPLARPGEAVHHLENPVLGLKERRYYS